MSLRQANWVRCEGEAHSNAFIDNCGVCMPHWGMFPVCPSCGRQLRAKKSVAKQVLCCGRVVKIDNKPRELPPLRPLCQSCGVNRADFGSTCIDCRADGVPADYNGPLGKGLDFVARRAR